MPVPTAEEYIFQRRGRRMIGGEVTGIGEIPSGGFELLLETGVDSVLQEDDCYVFLENSP